MSEPSTIRMINEYYKDVVAPRGNQSKRELLSSYHNVYYQNFGEYLNVNSLSDSELDYHFRRLLSLLPPEQRYHYEVAAYGYQ